MTQQSERQTKDKWKEKKMNKQLEQEITVEASMPTEMDSRSRLLERGYNYKNHNYIVSQVVTVCSNSWYD